MHAQSEDIVQLNGAMLCKELAVLSMDKTTGHIITRCIPASSMCHEMPASSLSESDSREKS